MSYFEFCQVCEIYFSCIHFEDGYNGAIVKFNENLDES